MSRANDICENNCAQFDPVDSIALYFLLHYIAFDYILSDYILSGESIERGIITYIVFRRSIHKEWKMLVEYLIF